MAFFRFFLVSGHNGPFSTLPSPDHGLCLGGRDLSDEPLDIVGGGDHRALPRCLTQTAIPQMETHPTFEFRKGMLHAATDGTQLLVPLLLLRGKRMPSRCSFHNAVELFLFSEAFLLLLVDVGAVLEDCRLVPVQYLVFMNGVMILGGGGEHLPDVLPVRVRGDVRLVAVEAVIVLLREGGLRITGGCSVFPLSSLRHFANGGIDALAARDDDASCSELAFHFHEERFVPLLFDENLAEPADRRLIGNIRIGGDAEKLSVRGTVMDVLLRLGIGESEELLQECDTKQHFRVEWLSSAFEWMQFCMPSLRK